jgi:hypothetical protein
MLMRGMQRPLRTSLSRNMAIFPEKTLKPDQASHTSIATILDRTAEALFMTEIFRGLWLTFEVAMKPKVTINYPFEKGPLSPRFRGEHGIKLFRFITGKYILIHLCT